MSSPKLQFRVWPETHKKASPEIPHYSTPPPTVPDGWNSYFKQKTQGPEGLEIYPVREDKRRQGRGVGGGRSETVKLWTRPRLQHKRCFPYREDEHSVEEGREEGGRWRAILPASRVTPWTLHAVLLSTGQSATGPATTSANKSTGSDSPTA